jgi:hypothetical protein
MTAFVRFWALAGSGDASTPVQTSLMNSRRFMLPRILTRVS